MSTQVILKQYFLQIPHSIRQISFPFGTLTAANRISYPQSSNMRILIADDQRDVAFLLAQMVASCDHETVGIVTTGGLDVIAAYDRLRPEVVIMDINMPRTNGFTACHVLRSRLPSPKIVFFSGFYRENHPFVMNAGADAYLAKPTDVATLQAVLSSLEAETALNVDAA